MAPFDSSSEQAAIRAARDAQNRAIEAGQWEQVATFWVRDVLIVAGLGAVIQGRDAYRLAFAADPGMVYRREPGSIEVSQQWPLGWEAGSWSGRRRESTLPIVTGRYSAHWVKVKQRWLIRSELFVALTSTGEARQWPITPSW